MLSLRSESSCSCAKALCSPIYPFVHQTSNVVGTDDMFRTIMIVRARVRTCHVRSRAYTSIQPDVCPSDYGVDLMQREFSMAVRGARARACVCVCV
jgi:hypothetical protein